MSERDDHPTPPRSTKLRSIDEADRMWAALEGDLDREENARFEARLQTDEALRSRVREARSMQQLLPLYEAPEWSGDLLERALDRAAASALLRPVWYRRRISLPLPFAAALLIGVGLGLGWLIFGSSGNAIPPAESGAESSPVANHAPATEADRGAAEADSDVTDLDRALGTGHGTRRGFGPRIVIGAAGSAAGIFDFDAEDELFPLETEAGDEDSVLDGNPGEALGGASSGDGSAAKQTMTAPPTIPKDQEPPR